MRKSLIHLICAYVTEALAIVSLVMWFMTGKLGLMLPTLIMVIVSATFHVTYMLSVLYEKLEKIEKKVIGGDK